MVFSPNTRKRTFFHSSRRQRSCKPRSQRSKFRRGRIDQNLSIRGLGPDFSTTLLNGREQVSTGDNRGVEYDQYPSEFFRSVNVYKSADASLIAAGIAGTVDLRSLRPLSQPHRIIAVSARALMDDIKALNPDSSRYGYRASATYVDKFADDTLGIALGFSATDTPTQNERYNAWGYSGSGTATDPYTLGGAKPYVQSDELKRYGAVGTLEFQPSDSFHSKFDALYSHFENTQHLRGIEFPFSFDGAAQSNTTVTNGFVTSATFVPNYSVQRNDYNKRTSNEISLGWNNDFKLGDRVHFNVDAAWSHAKRTDFDLENYTGTGYSRTGTQGPVKVSQNANGTFNIMPTLDYTDTNVIKITDPGGWGYNGTQAVVQAGFLGVPSFVDDLKSLRGSFNGEFENSVVKGWEVGGNFSRRRKEDNYGAYFLCPKGAGTNCTVASGTPTSEAIPSAAVLGSIPLGFLGVPAIIALNPLYLYNNVYNGVFDNRPSQLVRDNVITEDVYTGYAKLNIDGVVGGKNLKGSIGAQVVHTYQRSTGSTSSLGPTGAVSIFPASGGTTYTNVLPSATFSLELEPSFFVKMGASQTLVRPRMDTERVNSEIDLNSAVNASVAQPITMRPFSITTGNVNLKPYQSTNIDLSIERYFSKGGYISAAGYFKHLTDYVDANASGLYDFTAYAGLLPAGTVVAPGNLIGLSSQPNNDGRGYLLGTEVTASMPFAVFSSALDGLGVFASGSYTQSDIRLGSNPSQSITLPGLSAYVASGEFYFEKHGFQIRGSYRYRSTFLAEVSGLSSTPTYRNTKAEAIVDAQIGYEFQSGFLKGLSILAQAENLTDRPFITFQNNDPRQVIDYQRYGRKYYLGASYKF
ncbi:MAG: TonB-dependent receptor [Janthinobacterium lividum]